MKNTVIKKFKIKDMDCSSCAVSIDWFLEDIDGIKQSKTNYAKSVVEVEIDIKKINDQKVIEAIKKSGYTALPLK